MSEAHEMAEEAQSIRKPKVKSIDCPVKPGHSPKERAFVPSADEEMLLRLEAACHFAETGASVAMGYIRLLKEKLGAEILGKKIIENAGGNLSPTLEEVLDTIYWSQERMILEIEKLEGEETESL